MPSVPPASPASAPAGRKALPKLLVGLAAVAALVLIAFIAFGSSSNSVIDPVATAATTSANSSGYRMRMAMEISSSALSAPITASGSGSFDARDHTGSMSMVMDVSQIPQAAAVLGGGSLQIDEIVDHSAIYMRLPSAVAGTISGGKPWFKVDLQNVPGFSSLQSAPGSSDPSQVLEYLRAASDSVIAEGRERVDGHTTTHYRALLDLGKVPDAVPPSYRAAAQQAMATLSKSLPVSTLPVDVWIDRHHLVRRIVMNISATTSTQQTMNVSMTVDVLKYGPQPRPVPPPDSEVQDMSKLAGLSGQSP